MLKNSLLLFALFLLCFGNSNAQSNATYIIAGTFYDSQNNTLLKDQVLHIEGSEIKALLKRQDLPKNANIIDLSAYTVLPGLIDAHTHVLFSQDANEDFAESSINTLTLESEALRVLRGAKRAKSYLDVGFTSIKDLGNSGQFLDVALRDAIDEGSIIGPRVYASGPILSSVGGQIYGVSPKHQHLVDLEYRVITSVDDARNAVREHINQNVDLIKICADNIPNNTRLNSAEMTAIVETAHQYGLKVTAHSISNQSAWEAIQAGVDGIEHGFFLEDSTLTAMATKNVFLVPTENSRNYMNTYSDLAGYTSEERDFIDGYLNRSKDRLKRAIEKGVTIVAGSDNYTDIKTTRGVSSKDLFRAYFEAGMAPLDILQSATFVSAQVMNQDHAIGVLKTGAKADIIAVKGDLLNDFVNSINTLVFVMKDGQIHLNTVE